METAKPKLLTAGDGVLNKSVNLKTARKRSQRFTARKRVTSQHHKYESLPVWTVCDHFIKKMLKSGEK